MAMNRKIERIAAYILSIPTLVVLAIVAPVVMLLALPPLSLMVFRKKRFATTTDAPISVEPQGGRKHAIVTGGSSGIGYSIALDCVRRGMDRVTILARNQSKLNEAKAMLEEETSTTEVNAVSADTSDPAALTTAALGICATDGNDGKHVTTYLFACVGVARPGNFSEIDPDTFAIQAQANYLGTLNTVHSFLPFVKRGTIVLTSSSGGQVGVFGYTAYAPPKFALRGFAEALHMELLCREVSVQVAYPPDTDTPGYKNEQGYKPRECQLISETAGLFQPEEVGRQMVREAIRPNPKFSVYFGLEGWMLSTLTAGMNPESSLIEVIYQVGLMGLFRFVSFLYLNDFWDMVRNCREERKATDS